jgi:transcriptional regulator with XRE-family HTH domain
MTYRVYPQELGDYIAKLREGSYPSRRVFAKKIGLDPATVGNIENGYTESPGLEAIVAIAEGLHIDESKLIAIYKGKNPDAPKEIDEPAIKHSITSLIQAIPASWIADAVDPKMLAEAILQHDGPEKFKELVKEAQERMRDV